MNIHTTLFRRLLLAITLSIASLSAARPTRQRAERLPNHRTMERWILNDEELRELGLTEAYLEMLYRYPNAMTLKKAMWDSDRSVFFTFVFPILVGSLTTLLIALLAYILPVRQGKMKEAVSIALPTTFFLSCTITMFFQMVGYAMIRLRSRFFTFLKEKGFPYEHASATFLDYLEAGGQIFNLVTVSFGASFFTCLMLTKKYGWIRVDDFRNFLRNNFGWIIRLVFQIS